MLRLSTGRDSSGGRADLKHFVQLHPDSYWRPNVDEWIEFPNGPVGSMYYSTSEKFAVRMSGLLGQPLGLRGHLDNFLLRCRRFTEQSEKIGAEDKAAFVREVLFWTTAVRSVNGKAEEARRALEELLGRGWRDWKRFDATKAFDAIRSDAAVLELRKKFPSEP